MIGIGVPARAFLHWLVAGAISLSGAGMLHAQSAGPTGASAPMSGAQVRFEYENKQLQPAKYTFLIDESGSGHFHSEPGNPPPSDTASYQTLAEPLDRPVQISRPVVEQIFSTARGEKLFAITCEDGKNKIAYQGMKQLSYRGPGRQRLVQLQLVEVGGNREAYGHI